MYLPRRICMIHVAHTALIWETKKKKKTDTDAETDKDEYNLGHIQTKYL